MATRQRRLTLWVRGGLVVVTVGLIALFVVAWWLEPYGFDGRPMVMGTHQQLGLPPCSFYRWTHLPCPSCGMTTSFAFLVRGDIGNSLRANAVGTVFALWILLMIPWNLLCAVRGRLLWIRSLERALTILVACFIGLLLLRWFILLGLTWLLDSRW
jgi:hypothetical protein